MIGIICPSIFEYRYIRSMKLPVKKATIVRSGMGKLRALDACYRLKTEHPRLQRILLIGYAGGLSGLKVGDLIEPNTFLEYDFDARPFEKYPHKLQFKQKKIFSHSRRCAILTQDRFLTSNPLEGTPLGKQYPVMACDMESYAVAYFSKISGIPVSIFKLISDEADAHAEHDFLKACKDLSGKLKACVQQAIDL